MKPYLLWAVCLAARVVLAQTEGDPYDRTAVPIEVDTPDASLTKIVLVAGGPSHGAGAHEYFAGCAMLANMLRQTPGVFPVLVQNGWPTNPKIFDGARAIVFYTDGGGGHPVLQGDRLKTLGEHMKQGTGLVCLHWSCEPTREKGQAEWIDWLGGAFEIHWSVNPYWEARFERLPEHPIARGVSPFTLQEEWYFHMRFAEGLQGVTPILSAHPGPKTLRRENGPYEGNPEVRRALAAGEIQHVAWAFERPDGARGFGFTGGHFHENWGDVNVRRLVVNAILWTAKQEVPAGGAPVALDPAALNRYLDKKF